MVRIIYGKDPNFNRYLYPVSTEQKISRSLSGSQSRFGSGSRSRGCTHLYRTFFVQYNKSYHMVVHCLVIVTSQSTKYRYYNDLDRDPDRAFTQDQISRSRSLSRSQST